MWDNMLIPRDKKLKLSDQNVQGDFILQISLPIDLVPEFSEWESG